MENYNSKMVLGTNKSTFWSSIATESNKSVKIKWTKTRTINT